MFKVIDIFRVGNRLSVTLDGVSDSIKIGSSLIDQNGKTVKVVSIGMVRYTDPQEIGKTTTILVEQCDLDIGSELSIA